MTAVTLVLAPEDLRHFEALMRLRRLKPGWNLESLNTVGCHFFYEPKAAAEWEKALEPTVIRLYDHTPGRQILAELNAHEIPYTVRTP